jgi:hypothetical protein
MNLGTRHLLRFRVGHFDTFHEVLGVFSECMVKREKLSMLVERRKLATLLQPNELYSCLAYRAWKLLVDTPGGEYPISQEVMHGVLVPNIHFEVLLCSLVVSPYAIIPSTDQFIINRFHVHTHFTSRVPRNYQHQEYILPLK